MVLFSPSCSQGDLFFIAQDSSAELSRVDMQSSGRCSAEAWWPLRFWSIALAVHRSSVMARADRTETPPNHWKSKIISGEDEWAEQEKSWQVEGLRWSGCICAFCVSLGKFRNKANRPLWQFWETQLFFFLFFALMPVESQLTKQTFWQQQQWDC